MEGSGAGEGSGQREPLGRAEGRSLLPAEISGHGMGLDQVEGWRAGRLCADFEIETCSCPGVLQRDPEISKHLNVRF